MTDMWNTMSIASAGMKVQGARVRVIAENIANADTGPLTPGGDPYKRQVITFKNQMDREQGMKMVQVDKISTDKTNAFVSKYMPQHPGADDNGYVKMPNINGFTEMMDMREAQRTYEANLGMIEQSRDMMQRTISLLE